jgi:hypothetical protein
MCTPFLLCATTHTYPGAHITMKCAHPFFDNNSRALLRCMQNQNLVPTTHQPICTFTKGFRLWTLHSPPPYLCIVLSALYTHVHTKFQKYSKICRYSTCIASSRSQVASLGLYQVHWNFTSSMDQFRSCLIFRSNMKTNRTRKSPSGST